MRSGLLGCHSTAPRLPYHRPGRDWSKMFLALTLKWLEAPSCWNIQCLRWPVVKCGTTLSLSIAQYLSLFIVAGEMSWSTTPYLTHAHTVNVGVLHDLPIRTCGFSVFQWWILCWFGLLCSTKTHSSEKCISLTNTGSWLSLSSTNSQNCTPYQCHRQQVTGSLPV